jgi:hypothetical protein
MVAGWVEGKIGFVAVMAVRGESIGESGISER